MGTTASSGAALAGGYAIREVAGLIGLSEAQVRQYVRRGVVEPTRGERGEHRFSFRDVVLLRMAKRLLDENVSPRKALATLTKLKSGGRPLASMRVLSQGDEVLVRERAALWNVDSGQGHFNFEANLANAPSGSTSERLDAERSAEVATLATRRGLPPGRNPAELGADEWYNLGLDLEEANPALAPDAYARAIALDAQHVDAHVNLGRLHQLRGDLRLAKRHYQLALEALPQHQLANYNMGTVFDELEETETAAAYYLKSVNVPDAHYNLARIFEMRGDEVSSLRHLRKHRQLLDGEEP